MHHPRLASRGPSACLHAQVHHMQHTYPAQHVHHRQSYTKNEPTAGKGTPCCLRCFVVQTSTRA